MATIAKFPKIICRVKALYAFSSTEKSSLSFEKDEYIEVLSQLDSGWWDGWCRGNRGWFPSNYVEIMDVNPDLVQEINHHDFSGRNSPISPTPFIPNDDHDDSEEEARTINLIRNMNNGNNLASPIDLTRPNSLTLPTSIATAATKRIHNQHTILPQLHDDEDEENDTHLPEGWTLQIADDGLTKFYFNQQTGGLRWNHPGISDSDEEDEEEENESSGDEEYDQHQQQQELDHFDDYDFGKSKPQDNSNFSVPPSPTVNLMEHWIKKTTPQGKLYYGNSITHETTWDYNEIDISTGHLKKSHLDINKKHANNEENDNTLETTTSSASSSTSSLALMGEDHGPITWKSIAIKIAQSVQNLNKAVVRGENVFVFRQKIAIVVDAVRLMLYSSRSLDKDAVHLQDVEIKEPHRNVLSTLAKLILSAKVVHDSNLDINGKVQRDAADVLNSVRKFVLICQQKNVHIEQVNPRLLSSTDATTTIPVNISGEDISDEVATKRKSSNGPPPPPPPPLPRAKYPLNQDLIVSLQTHAKQIVGSTDALCKASAYIYTLEEKQQKQEQGDYSEEQSFILDQRARSNVVLLFQNLSSQIGTYLAILGDIDTNHIIVESSNNSNPIQSSLPEFRSNKQRLYNSVGLLFSAVQTLTDIQNDLMTSITLIEEIVNMVEDSIEDIFSTIVQMVGERKIWLMRNDTNNGGGGGGGPRSPIHSYFEIDQHKKRPHRKSINDASDNEVVSPILSRLYHRQGSQQGLTPQQQAQQHRPSISSNHVTPSNLTRPTAENALKRQFSFGHGASAQDDESQFWYLGYDYAEGDIVFTQEKSIKGGTLAALVERLTLHDFIDMSFIANFLLTYRSFCTTEEFVELLQERYNLAPPEELTPDELEIWTDKKQKLVRLRVFNVMKNWLENYYNDEDEFILNKLQFFANTVICDSSSFSAEQLNRLIRKRRELDANGGGLKKLIPNATSGPMPIVPKNMQQIRFLDTDPLELARQLTIMDFKLYSSIRPIECLGKAWSKDASDNAVNVKQSIDYCNKLTSWVTGSILSHREAKKRVVAIKHWSQIANRCLEMNNYNTCMAILSAFDNSAVGRLKKTWELVSSRTSQSLAQIRKLMGSNRNFTEYREMIHSVNPPCIPFLGIYLQDLTFIEDGNPDLLKKSSNLINFAKQQKSAEVIREIKQFQSPPYIFQFVPEIQEFIKFQLETSRDVDFLYERSLELEPRVATTE